MSNTVPTPITDKNGKKTTVHKKSATTPKADRLKNIMPAAPKVDTVDLSAEYLGIYDLDSKPDNHKLKIDYALLGAMKDEIGIQRGVFISNAQLEAIGKKAVGDDFKLNFKWDSPEKEIMVTSAAYREILDALVNDPADTNLYSEADVYNLAKDSWFLPALDQGYLPDRDDTFSAGWEGGLERGKKLALQSPTEPSGRGRTDVSWMDKATAAARMDAGVWARRSLGIETLNPTGNILDDSHKIGGKQLLDATQSWLTDNKLSASVTEIRDAAVEFLGDEWNQKDIFETGNDQKQYVNVRDLREFFAEIAINKER